MSFVLTREASPDCEVGAVYPNPHLQEFQDSDLYQQDSNSLVTYTQIPLYGQEPDLSRVTYTTGDTDLQVTYASSVESDLNVKYGQNTAGSSYGGSAGSIDDGSYDEDRPHSRLTIIESPTPSFDQDLDEELSQLSHFSLESPDLVDEKSENHPHIHPHHSGSGKTACYTCDECLKTFSSPGKLRQHEYSHTGETPFECKIAGCDKKFTSKFKLKRHILIHSQTKTFLCDVCNRAFRRKDHLKNHEKVHDPGKTVYSCSYETCGRTYNSISSFRKHQAMHCAEEGQLDCKICKVVLSTRDELINHLKVHAGSRTVKGAVDKKFMCNQCEKKFFTRKDLKRHSVVHTGNREFSCPHCTQRFGRKDHMTRHAKKTHASFYPDGTSPGGGRAGGQGRTRFVSSPGKPPASRPARTQRKERSISDPGPMRVPDTKMTHEHGITEDKNEESKKTVGLPRHVIVHHSTARGTTELENSEKIKDDPDPVCFSRISGGGLFSSGGSVTYCDSYDDNIYRIQASHHHSPPGIRNLQSPSGGDFQRLHSPPSGEFQRLMTMEAADMVIKEEDPCDEYYTDADNSEETAIRELLGVKDRIDLSSLMHEFGDRKLILPPPSPQTDMEDNVIKMEPNSPPPSPMLQDDTPGPPPYCYNEPSSLVTLQPPPPLTPAPKQPPAASSSVFLRSPSQDSITRTKNPVLPSIHTETCLVVPELNTIKYPGSQAQSQPGHTHLLFTTAETDQLTELRGSLFMSDEYGQPYFQPWN